MQSSSPTSRRQCTRTGVRESEICRRWKRGKDSTERKGKEAADNCRDRNPTIARTKVLLDVISLVGVSVGGGRRRRCVCKRHIPQLRFDFRHGRMLRVALAGKLLRFQESEELMHPVGHFAGVGPNLFARGADVPTSPMWAFPGFACGWRLRA